MYVGNVMCNLLSFKVYSLYMFSPMLYSDLCLKCETVVLISGDKHNALTAFGLKNYRQLHKSIGRELCQCPNGAK